MNYYPEGTPEGVPQIIALENGNNFVEWNIVTERKIDESILSNLNKKLSVNGLSARCFKTNVREMICKYEYPATLSHEIYWDTALRNLLVIEKETENLISIENRPRKYWKLRFVATEHKGGFTIDKTPLMKAIQKSSIEEAIKLIKKSSIEEINRKTPFGVTALHYAIFSKNTDYAIKPENTEKNIKLVKMLLEFGAETNVSGEITPIQTASVRSLEVIKLLVSKNAKIDLLNKYNETALMFAASAGNADSVSWLLENGADKNLIDVFGNSALNKAQENKHYKVERILGLT